LLAALSELRADNSRNGDRDDEDSRQSHLRGSVCR
jgi:hypothetical protein